MDAIESIFKQYESETADANERFEKILAEFFNIADEQFRFLGYNTSFEKALVLMNRYIGFSKYFDAFYEILRKYNYNFFIEIRSLIPNLACLKNPNHNIKVIKKYLISPVIQDISYNGKGKFTIFSDELGEFSFALAKYYYSNVPEIIHYIRKEKLSNRCHDHTYFLSSVKKCENFYAVTSLCRAFFNGTFYHSYMLDKERDIVTDLCDKAVFDKDTFYRLYQLRELSVIPNSEVLEQDKIVIEKTNQPSNRCSLLRIALYKQYLESIGYTGDLADGPSLKKVIKK